MDIYSLIHNDHEDAKKVIEQINALPDSSHSQRFMLFKKLKTDLITHNDAEAASFYEALRQHSDTRDQAAHSEHEHDEAAAMLEKLDDRRMEPAEWRLQFAKFQQALFHHIREEESEVFAQARTVFNPETAIKLVDTMQRLKFMKQEVLKKAS